ncbi:hypothetical protein AYI69_g7709 [Smittium culicis]|uniref:Uncharacterized protein n=1 Tax=Smittium culicis TaxID=133412 RepID=A0A1R1XQ62_9FUNG|nr:hypothetical protein AYI69_g7709 [Smittium culicis]
MLLSFILPLGTVILNIEEKKLTLKDEENAVLTTYRVKAKDIVEEGSDIDIGKYLISIDSEIGNSSAVAQITKPPHIAPRTRVLLKRNSTFVSPFARKKVNLNKATESKPHIVVDTSESADAETLEKIFVFPRDYSENVPEKFIPVDEAKLPLKRAFKTPLSKSNFSAPSRIGAFSNTTSDISLTFPDKKTYISKDKSQRKLDIPTKFVCS